MNNNVQIACLSFASRNLKSNCRDEIQAIINESREHNKAKGITGKLVYRTGIFLQLLEGDKDEVQLLLGRILLDSKRHENIRILFNQPMKNRLFPEWSVVYKNLDNNALDLVNSIVPWQKLTGLSSQNNVVSNDDILSIFETLAA